MKNFKKSLSEKNVSENPFTQFDIWFRERIVPDNEESCAVCLGTSGTDGFVSVRMLLLKEYDENGFVFYTNYESKKGNQIKTNPYAALLFYWSLSARQIRVEGKVEKVTENISDEYFKKRPYESQISAWASEQSFIIAGRDYLEKRVKHFQTRFRNGNIERPSNWGGYRLIPHWFEFWQEGEHRLHDRITYTASGEKWIIGRLAP